LVLIIEHFGQCYFYYIRSEEKKYWHISSTKKGQTNKKFNIIC
jgi:hypothetical protein